MKKVLIIGYLFPYCRYEGGSPRTFGLSSYLAEFGWEPIVLTPLLSQKADFRFKIIETPYRDTVASLKSKIRLNPSKGFQEQVGVSRASRENNNFFINKLFTSVKSVITYPDEGKGWKPFALKEAEKLLEKEKIDAIISFWPITAHLVAKELKNKYNIPWVADFSHLWSQGYYYQYGSIRRFFDRRLEIKTLLKAEALTTISRFFVSLLKKIHKRRPIYNIIHGFDPLLVNIPPVAITDKFSITYTGAIYSEKYKPSKLFKAIKELIDDKFIDRKDVRIIFYGSGSKDEWFIKEINQYNLSDIVLRFDAVSYLTSIQKQRESQILLHLGWDDENFKEMYNSKIFDYMAARRPILSVGGASSEIIKEILLETNAGVYGSKVEEIKKFLKEFYSEYKREGRIHYRGNQEKINKYSYRELAKKFADVLNSLK